MALNAQSCWLWRTSTAVPEPLPSGAGVPVSVRFELVAAISPKMLNDPLLMLPVKVESGRAFDKTPGSTGAEDEVGRLSETSCGGARMPGSRVDKNGLRAILIGCWVAPPLVLVPLILLTADTVASAAEILQLVGGCVVSSVVLMVLVLGVLKCAEMLGFVEIFLE